MELPKDPETGKPYNFLPESEELTTKKEKETAALLVQMTHALEEGNERKAEKISERLVQMWKP